MTPQPHQDAATDEAGQAGVIAFLSDPRTHGGAAVARVDTHISRLFLAGDRVWKMKRAIRTNYLDFSTLARRKAGCLRELQVNAGAGGLYLGVVAVTRDAAGGLTLGGAGAPVEWLVEMRRFDSRDELGRMCDEGRLSRAEVERLADRIAEDQARAPVTPGFGDDADIRARIDQIAGALAAASPALATRAEGWRTAAQAARAGLAPLIARRLAEGRIRRCHGDLHLDNVVMIDGQPTPFDAIEFNEAIASIDVLYDVALTVVDLCLRGRRDLANALRNRYLGATGDWRGLAMEPLFLSMRAAVRAMTAASRGETAAAMDALGFAEAAIAPRPRPRLIAVGGLSGSGKTTVARALAPDFGAPPGAVVIRSDVTRKRLFAAAPESPLPEADYGPRANLRVRAAALRAARDALRAGATVILDATFLSAEWRAGGRALAARLDVPFFGIWLDLPAKAAIDRVRARRADASDATPEVVARQSSRLAPPQDWARIDAQGSIDQTVEHAADALGQTAPITAV